jgi:hypothetical protein
MNNYNYTNTNLIFPDIFRLIIGLNRFLADFWKDFRQNWRKNPEKQSWKLIVGALHLWINH